MALPQVLMYMYQITFSCIAFLLSNRCFQRCQSCIESCHTHWIDRCTPLDSALGLATRQLSRILPKRWLDQNWLITIISNLLHDWIDPTDRLHDKQCGLACMVGFSVPAYDTRQVCALLLEKLIPKIVSIQVACASLQD